MKAELKLGGMEARVLVDCELSAIPAKIHAKHVPTKYWLRWRLNRFRVYINVDNSLYIKYNYTHVPLTLIDR